MIRWFPALVTLAVVGGHAWYYFIYRGFPLTVSFANAVTAFSATITLTLSFALGPVSHVVARLKHVRTYRKDFGLIGYGLASAHVLLAAWAVMERADPIAYSDAASLAFAAVSFGIFSMLALTSNTTWIRRLGFENWKALQRTGYMALVFALIHVALLGQGVFL
jgi:DMSO/TMAO reductase YedYZ heme-binding membrane subunit